MIPTQPESARRQYQPARRQYQPARRQHQPARRQRQPAQRPRQPRPGYTLLELLLVLALVVVIASLALPSFRGAFDNQRLRKSGELIRAEWSRARVEAMRSGQMYLFRYQLNGSQFQVEPWFRQEDLLEMDLKTTMQSGGGQMSGGGMMANPLQAGQTQVRQRELPEKVLFGDMGYETDTRLLLMEDDMQVLQNQGLSTPIIFYPDGTTSNAKLVLYNQYGYSVLLELRSLTGLSKVSSLIGPGRPLVMQ